MKDKIQLSQKQNISVQLSFLDMHFIR